MASTYSEVECMAPCLNLNFKWAFTFEFKFEKQSWRESEPHTNRALCPPCLRAALLGKPCLAFPQISAYTTMTIGHKW